MKEAASAGKRRGGANATCRAAVRRVLRERGADAEDVLVALVDAIVDSYVDAELRERGLGPPPSGVRWADALNAVQAAVYYAQLEFGKGFGRRPARGRVADVTSEQALFFSGDGSAFTRKLTPVQRALGHVVAAGWAAAVEHLDRVDPRDDDDAE